MRILLIEDYKQMVRALKKGLEEEGFAVDVALDGEEGGYKAETADYDVIILDLMLPKEDGLSLLKRWRAKGIKSHVLVLTARSSIEDKVTGLDLGADDYMTKPFAFRELVLRLQNLLKRAGELHASAVTGPVRIGIATVDFERFTADSGGGVHRLTHKECAVLKLLVEQAGRAVSRDEILSRAWAPEPNLTTSTLPPAFANVFSASAMIATAPQIVVWMPNRNGPPCARASCPGIAAAMADPPSKRSMLRREMRL